MTAATGRQDNPYRELAGGLRFPEGPVVLPGGDVAVMEIAAGRITRVSPDGSTRLLAQTGGGPNGAALGPDGKLYVCNNGGLAWHDRDGRLFPLGASDNYAGGSIQRVDIATGAVETLYADCNGQTLHGPNDIVFDRHGGFWFTDLGKTAGRAAMIGAVYYAAADGSAIKEVIGPFDHGNGIGLSPDGDRLYVAQTPTARLWAYDIEAPGVVRGGNAKRPLHGTKGTCLTGLGGYRMFDSLAVDGAGNICVATLFDGGISVIAPDGRLLRHVALPDPAVTNICFGGPDLRTAYVTLSSTGRLVTLDWPEPGLRLAC